MYLMVSIIPDTLTDVDTTKAGEYKSRNLCRISKMLIEWNENICLVVELALVIAMLQLDLAANPTSCRPVACSTIRNSSPSELVKKLG